MKNFRIILYRDNDFADFQDYIRSAFHEKYILSEPRFLKWQYRPGELCLAKDGNKIVGHFGFRDLLYKIYDQTQTVRVLINLFVLKPYRLSGVGAVLAQEVFNTPNKILVSGYSSEARKLFFHFRQGWQEAGNLERWLAILEPAAPLFRDYRIPATIFSEKKAENIEIKEAIPDDHDFELLWQEIKKRYPVTIERTPEYLKWRFFNHPLFRYLILVAREGSSLQGYLIWRLEEDQNFKIARIIDLVATKETEKPLLERFLEAAQKEKAAAADFMCSGKLCRDSFSKSGFFNTVGTDFEKFPILFNPISYKKTFINIAYDIGAPFKDGYFTKADGDQDRPNPR